MRTNVFLFCLAMLYACNCYCSELENRVLSRTIARDAVLSVSQLCCLAERSITVYTDNLNLTTLTDVLPSLKAALDKKIEVSVFLFTEARPANTDVVSDTIVELVGHGAVVHGVVSRYRFQSTTVVVDGRFIIEDSSSPGDKPFEGAIVLDSETTAELLSERAGMFPLFSFERERNSEDNLSSDQQVMDVHETIETLEKTIKKDESIISPPVPVSFLHNKNQMARIVALSDEAAFNAYFLLIMEGARRESAEYFIDLVEFRDLLNASLKNLQLSDRALLALIKRMNSTYGIVGVAVLKNSRISVLLDTTDEVFYTDLQLFNKDMLRDLSMREKVSCLISSFMLAQQKVINDFTPREFKRTFHFDRRWLER